MGALDQTGLLLWKNILLRIRFPGVLLLEVLWPILIVGVVAIMRTSVPPIKNNNCHYQPRAMPSAGAVPFFQTFLCNLNNKCYNTESKLNAAKQNSERFTKLTQDLAPYLGSPKVLDMLAVASKSAALINTIERVAGDTALLDGLDRYMNISSYFRDPAKVKEILVNDYNLSQSVVDAVMGSRLNVAKLLTLTGTPDVRAIVCDRNQLVTYFKFPPQADVSRISEALCSINDSQIAELANSVIKQLNVTAILNALEVFERLKERFGVSNTLSLVFGSLAQMLETVMSSESIIRYLGEFAAIPNIADILRKIPDWISGFSSFSSSLNVIKDVVSLMEPLMASLKMENSTVWKTVNGGITIGINIIKLVDNKWNGTTQEFVQPIKELLQNLKLLSQEEGSQEAGAVLEFFINMDWLSVYSDLRTSKMLNKGTILHILEDAQEMLVKLPGWSVIQKVARIAQHGMDMVSILTEKSTDLKHALWNISEDNVRFRNQLTSLFQYGPVVTRALLEAFTSPQVLSDIMTNSSTYLSVCSRVVAEIQTRVPDDVLNNVSNTLCAGDVMAAMEVVVERMKLSEIRDLINATVKEIELLYAGDFYAKTVVLADLYNHWLRLETAFHSYIEDGFTWSQLFLNVTFSSIDLNQAGWQQVTELLNESFLSKGILALVRSLGKNLQSSAVAQDIAPYVHVMSQLTEMVYNLTNQFSDVYGIDSTMMKAVRLFTNYMPDIVKGFSFLWNHNMEALFVLGSSPEPLNTFCNGSYLSKMNLPAQVPASELNSLICDTDWPSVWANVMRPGLDLKDSIVQIVELLSNDMGTSSELEGDWNNMVTYTEEIIDTFNSGKAVNANGYMTLIDSMNLTKLEEGFEAVWQIMDNITSADPAKMKEFAVSVLENMDKTLRSDSSWQSVKWYLSWLDANLDLLTDSTQLLQNMSIQAVLDMYPPEVRRVATLFASAYPQFVKALKNIMLDPAKLVNLLLQQGLNPPDCVHQFVSDYTLLARDSSVHALESFVCSLNATSVAESFSEGPPFLKDYSHRMTELLQEGNTSVDWSRFMAKINTFIDQASSLNFNEKFDFYPFNVSAINMSWQEFYRAAELTTSMDLNKILDLAWNIQKLTVKLIVQSGKSDVTDEVLAALSTTSYVSYHFIKMLNAEMAFFNASAKVVLFNYLNSSELKKLTDFIISSPDINAVAVATLQRLLTSPQQAFLVTKFDELCANLTLFSQMFVLDVSSLAPAVLQATVCQLDVNFTLLLEQVESSRPSIKEFVASLLSTNFDISDMQVNFTDLMTSYTTFTDLLQSLTTDPPVIVVSEDERWMDLSLYQHQWETLWTRLTSLGEDLRNSSQLFDWESSLVGALLAGVEKVPGAGRALAYIDLILAHLQNMLDHTISNYEDLKEYTNLNRLLDLMTSAPEAVQSLIYTVMTQPEKALRWTTALQAWSTFCNTPASDIISVPPELNFNMAAFLDTACHIDVDELFSEMMMYQGVAALDKLNQTETMGINSSTLHHKLDKVFQSMADLINAPPSQESHVLARLMNVSVWEHIGDHIGAWLNETSFQFSSADKISQSVNDLLQKVFATMAPEVIDKYNQAITVAEVIMDQMLDSNTLQDAFRDLPSWQSLASLLNELPELFEAVVYTSLQHPEKISSSVSRATSWEAFCDVAGEMLIQPPNSSFDPKRWMGSLCSVNITRMVDEMGSYSLARKIEAILNGNYSGNTSLKSIVDKAESIINKVNAGSNISGHVFDASVWDQVIKRVSSWTRMWTSSSAQEMVVNWGSVVARTLLTTLENIPSTGPLISYLDTVLDLVQQHVGQLNDGFDGLYNYTNVEILLRLLEYAPEAVQTILYTTITEPAKTTRWSVAFQSKEKFCQTPASDILSVPAALNFSLSDYVAGACKLDVAALLQELAQYQGTDRLTAVLQGGPGGSYNTSLMLDKFGQLLKSITDSIEGPAMATQPLSRLFNVTLWEEVGGRIEVWAGNSRDLYSTPGQMSEAVNEILNAMFTNLPAETKDIYDKTVAIADIILGQILVTMNGNSLNTSLQNLVSTLTGNSLNTSLQDLPSLQAIVGLLNELPELYETVLYSSMHFPEKIAAKMSRVTSMEALCVNKPEDMFTLAPNSTFDVTAWFWRLCSINVTRLVAELQDYTVGREIERVMNGTSSSRANLSSVIDRAEQIVAKLNGGVTVNDWIFDPKVWESAMERVNSWVWPYKSVVDKLMGWESAAAEIVLAAIEKVPGAAKVLAYADVIVDYIQNMLDHTHSRYEDLKQYTNLNRIVSLLNVVPEAVQSLVFTALTQPEQALRWTTALQSWSTFCNTPASDIISVPHELNFNMAAFLDTACHIDVDELFSEMMMYQGVAALDNLNQTETMGINSSTLHHKLDKVFQSMADLINTPPSQESHVLARLMNVSVWEHIGDHIGAWLNETSFQFSSPEKISQSIGDLMYKVINVMPPEVIQVYSQAVAVAEVIVDQMTHMLDRSTLNDALAGLPSWQNVAALLNELPELFEALVYTSLYNPDKISSSVSRATSWEAFCDVAGEMLIQPPNSSFDPKRWMGSLCSVNITRMVDEMGSYSLARKIEAILNGNYSGNTSLKSIVDKAESIINKVNVGSNISGHVFDASVWDQVIKRVSSWTRMWTSSSAQEMLANWADLVAKVMLPALEKVKGTSQALAYIDAVLEVLQLQVGHIKDGFDGLYNYTSVEILLRLLEYAPEAVQTVLFTTITEPAKTTRWSVAFQSKETFCQTPASDILSVPAALNFSLSDYVAGACKLDVAALLQELAQYQGTDRLTAVLQGGPGGSYNTSLMLDKFGQLLKSITDSIEGPAMATQPLSRLFNVTLWEEVGGRIEVWAGNSRDLYSTPGDISATVGEILNVIFGQLPFETRQLYDRTTAVADIVLGQIWFLINSNSLNTSLQDLPSLQAIVGLLNELPELYETVLYSSMHFPDKIAAKMSRVTSMEALCVNKPEDMFTLAPNSTFDVTAWFFHLCSINITRLVAELQDYTVGREIERVMNGTSSSRANLTSVIDRAEQIVAKLNGGVTVNDRIFDPKVWKSAMERVNSWVWPYKSVVDFLKDEQKVLLRSLLAYIESTPGAGDMVYYLDAVVGLVASYLDKAHAQLPEAVQDFPTLRAITELVEQAPGLIDSVLYTLLVHPDKVLEWPSAIQSLPVFCSKDISKMISVASDSQFQLEAYKVKLCSVSLDRLVSELTAYQGFNQLHFIATGHKNSTINTTSLLEKTDAIVLSLEQYLNNPAIMGALNLQLFNSTVWQALGNRVQAWSSNVTVSSYLSAHTVAQIVDFFFGSSSSMGPDIKEAYDKGLAVTSILVDEVYMVIEASSLQEAVKGVPSLELILKLANQAPQLLETLVYTSVFHPDQVMNRVEALGSFEAFCAADVSDMFTVAPDSTFDLQSWVSALCSLNLTDIEKQLADYQTGRSIESIVNSSLNSHTNLTSVVDKLDSLMKLIGQGVSKSDQLLNATLWTYMLARMEAWIHDYSLYDTALMSANIAELVLSKIMDQKMLLNMARSLNTVNLFMNVTISKLQAVADGKISLSSLFTNTDELVSLIEAYIRVGKNLPQAWISAEFDANKLVALFANTSRLRSLCGQVGGLASEIANTSQPSETVRDMSTFVCSVIDESLLRAVKDYVHYDDLEKQLAAIWNSLNVSPDFSVFAANVETFSGLIRKLANQSHTVSSSLTDRLDFTSTLDALRKISTDPVMIFRLLKLLGLAVESPLHQQQEIVKALSDMNSLAIMPVVNLLEALKARGVTLSSLAANPEALLDTLSTMADFGTQFAVLGSVLIKPQLQQLIDARSRICNGTGYEYYLLDQRLDTMNLPVPWQQMLTLICQAPDAETILKKMKEAGLTNVQIMVLVSKMNPYGLSNALSDAYNHDFGWIDLMSSLEKLTGLATQGQVNESGVSAMKSAWQSVKEILFDKSLASLLSYLNLMDSGQSQDWTTFKQFLRFFSSALNFVDGHVAKLGPEVKLQDVLPSSDQVARLIEDVFGISDVAEILTAVLDPNMFYRITLTETWLEVCADNSSLGNFIHFPAGTNVSAVRASLCMAVSNRSTSFQQLLSLFNVGDMFQQLDKLIHSELDDSPHNSTVWDDVHKSVLQLIHTAESMQLGRVNVSSLDTWFSAIFNALSSLQQGQGPILTSTCSSSINYLKDTEGFQRNRATISRVFTAFSLLSDLTRLWPELSELACTFSNETGFNLSGFVKKLYNFGFWENLIKAADQFINPPETVNCLAPLLAVETMMKMINSSLPNNGLTVSRTSQCLSTVGDNFGSMIASFAEMTSFMKEIVSVGQIPELQKLLQDPQLYSILSLFLSGVRQDNRVLHLADLLRDKAGAADYLRNTLRWTEPVVDSFLNASVSRNWVYFLNWHTELVKDALCSPDKLQQALSLPGTSPVNITELSRMICTAEVTNTINFLKNISASSEAILQMLSQPAINIVDFIKKISSEVIDAMVEFQDLIALMTRFMAGFDLDNLKESADLLDKIAQGHTLMKLSASLDHIVDDIVMVLPDAPGTKLAIEVMRTIAKGILSLDVLKDFLLKEVQVKDMVKNPQDLMLYLTRNLGFSNTTSQEIMDAVLSSRLFLGFVARPSYSCQEVLDMIIILNSSQATVKDLSDSVCSLDEAHLKGLVERLLPELDIGVLIAKYVTNSVDAILKSTNMTAAELDDIFNKMNLGLADLKRLSDIIKQSPNGTDIINMFGGSRSDSLISLNKLTPVLCGGSMADMFDMNFAPGAIISTSKDLKQELETGVKDNELDLPNEFCVTMYENIKGSAFGSILWTYLKPILRGKILFTPNNTVTRAIISKANKLFSLIEEVSKVAQSWAQNANNLLAVVDAAQNAKNLTTALQNDFVKALLSASGGVNVETMLSELNSLQAEKFDRNQLDTLQKIAEIFTNYSSCIVTDRFQAVNSEAELEQESFRLSRNNTFFAGIVFLNVGGGENSTSGRRRRRQATAALPEHVGYKIRMDVDNVMDTQRLKSALWKMAKEDNIVEDMRYIRGFIYIQDMVDTAIIEAHKDHIYKTPGFNIRQMPFPCHHEDSFIFLLGAYLVPVMITFTFLASLGVATHNLVYDRENGQEENLHVMGMLTGLNFLSWLASTMTLMALVCLILAIMLKYTNIFIYSNFFIMFLYLVDFCLSSVMLLYMVSAFFNQTTTAILFVLMVYLISYMPYILVVGLEVSMTFWQKTLACLASTTAFSFGALRLAYLEEGGMGIQWYNITEASPEDASFSWICIMMLIDSAGYFLIGWYVRNVKPGKYGISQPWYFPVKPSFWSSCFRARNSQDFDSVLASDGAGNLFEPAHEGLRPGIAIKNLTKTYSNKKIAVDNLTVNFYENEITSLLGHNGAAKTTTMNMICGILEPTSGQIFLNGETPGCCRHMLGVCPQQNALFYYMTVLEHMKFYAGIKGATNDAHTRMEIKKLLRDVDLWHVRNSTVQTLSYGMKRRLCVVLAFVGGSKTIVLDEPTSGVDPHARRNIWNLITLNKPGRTIVLSTHHLDESDILSDRVAIMHQGKLLCCGSPAFLKRVIGNGFTLTVVRKGQGVGKTCDEYCEPGQPNAQDAGAAILSHIQSSCPKAALVEQLGSDLTFKIPKDPSQMNVPFDQFFRKLDQSSTELSIESYGLTDTTLEEVFLTMTENAGKAEGSEVLDPVITFVDRAGTAHRSHSGEAKSDHHESLNFSRATRMSYGPQQTAARTGAMLAVPPRQDVSPQRTGTALVLSQVGALLLKRCHHYRRNWRMLLSAVFLPLIGLLIAMGFSSVKVNGIDTKPLVLDPSIYGPKTNTFYGDSINNVMSQKFVGTLTASPVGIGTACMTDWAVNYFDNSSCVTDSGWYNVSKKFFQVVCSNYNQVYSEMASNLTMAEKLVPSDELLQNINQQNIPAYLLRTFRDYRENRFGGWSFEGKAYGTMSDVDPFVWFSSKGYHAMPSFFNSMSNTVLRSQLPSGKVPSDYGITTINHPIRLGKAAFSVKNLQSDAADTGVALVIVVAFSFIPSGFILYVINERIQKQRQLQDISGVHFITYWLVALAWDLFVYAITVAVAVVIVVIFRTDSFYMRNNLAAFASLTLLYGWAIIPCMYCVNRLFKKGSTAFLVTFCLNLFLALITVISLLVLLLFSGSEAADEAYNVLRYLYLVFPQYALGQGLLDMASNTVKYKIFLRFGEDRYDDPFSLNSIGWHLIALGIEGLVFFLLTLALDGIPAPAVGLSRRKSSHKFTNIDEDVLREQERVQTPSKNDLLVVNDLSKTYRRRWKKFEAVSHISFGVSKGEAFGLLGVNGAGKTTTFRMLTGDSKPSAGTALLKGHKINVKQGYGYCSQEGGLDDYLTGEETLYFHSRLRGFNEKQATTIVRDLLTRLALTQYARRPVHTYSGGTKRKLSLAVALLGDPPILYLDEPTTGMDAATRRLAWKCIEQANRNGQSIVLTSHSMDECDVLCSRIAIMVNGQIKCIGSPQYLKHRFGDGYTVIVHSPEGRLNEVIKCFLSRFPDTIVKARHFNSVELQAGHVGGSVADMLSLLMSLQQQAVLDHYSLSQTTLDSVFISFAKDQSDNYEDESSVSEESPSCSSSGTPSESVSSLTARPSYLKSVSQDKYGLINPVFVSDEDIDRDGKHDDDGTFFNTKL